MYHCSILLTTMIATPRTLLSELLELSVVTIVEDKDVAVGVTVLRVSDIAEAVDEGSIVEEEATGVVVESVVVSYEMELGASDCVVVGFGTVVDEVSSHESELDDLVVSLVCEVLEVDDADAELTASLTELNVTLTVDEMGLSEERLDGLGEMLVCEVLDVDRTTELTASLVDSVVTSRIGDQADVPGDGLDRLVAIVICEVLNVDKNTELISRVYAVSLIWVRFSFQDRPKHCRFMSSHCHIQQGLFPISLIYPLAPVSKSS